MTYSDAKVVEALNRNFVPIKLDFEKSAKLVDQYRVIWTPSLNVIDGRERCFYSVEGWLPAQEFLAMLEAARGQYLLRTKQFDAAAEVFKDAYSRYPQSAFADEARYYRGVALYLGSRKPEFLKAEWEELRKTHPQSRWLTRADIFG